MAQEPVAVSEEPKHRLKFENRSVRVYEVAVPSGEATLFHYHEKDYFFVNLAGARLTSETPGQPGMDMKVEDGQVIYTAAPVTHRIRNTGETAFHNLTVELLGPAAQGGTAEPPPGENQTIVFENDLIRAVRTLLPPGGSTGLHKHECGVFLVRIGRGTIRAETAAGEAADFREGWCDAPLIHSLSNVGAGAAHLVEIEIKSSKHWTVPDSG